MEQDVFMDIFEQLEAGKKAQENGEIDPNTIYTSVGDTEEVAAEEKAPKEKKTSKRKKKEETTDEKAFRELPPPAQKPREELVDPDFDYNNYYTVGQTIFFVRVFDKLGTKENMKLIIRSIYPRCMIAVEQVRTSREKKDCGCVVLGYDRKDFIFQHDIDASTYHDSIDIKPKKYTTLAAETEEDEESEDHIGNEQESIEEEE